MNNVEKAKRALSKAKKMFGGSGDLSVKHNFDHGMYKCSNVEVESDKRDGNVVADTLTNVPNFHGSITEYVDKKCKEDGSLVITTIKPEKKQYGGN